MSDLRLLNPQPMETLELDESGCTYARFTWPSGTENTLQITFYKLINGFVTFHAWSYTATFEKGTP